MEEIARPRGRLVTWLTAAALAAAAAVGVLVVSAPGAAGATRDGTAEPRALGWYAYDGRDRCYPTATVVLRAHDVRSGHVAVWSGVSDPDAEIWAQAGVAAFPDGSTTAYLETKAAGRPAVFVRLADGRRDLTVRLDHVSARTWRLTAGGRTATVHLRTARCFAGAESWDERTFNGVSGTVRAGRIAYDVEL